MAATKHGQLLSDLCSLRERFSCPCSRAPSFSTFLPTSSVNPLPHTATFWRTLHNPLRTAYTFSGQHCNERRASISLQRHTLCSNVHRAIPYASHGQPQFLSPLNNVSRTSVQTLSKKSTSNSRERLGRLRAVRTEAPVDERKAEWGPELETWLAESGLPEQVRGVTISLCSDIFDMLTLCLRSNFQTSVRAAVKPFSTFISSAVW